MLIVPAVRAEIYKNNNGESFGVLVWSDGGFNDIILALLGMPVDRLAEYCCA